MLRHQFGQNLIFGLDLFLQIFDAFLLGLMIRAGFGLESGRSVLEEFLLPAVEHRRLQCQFVTQLRDRLLVHQVPPQNGHLFLGRVVLSFFSHAFSPLS